MNKLYSVHDHWTDIAKKNDVDIESIDGVIAGIKVNGEDYGGKSWETLFDGNVTTEEEPSGTAAASKLNNVNITADTIKVTFINTEYICNRDIDYISFGAAFDAETGSFDFSEYPFAMMFNSEIGAWNLFTPSSGTYSLKIEEPSSGGESDFSTAEVTIVNEQKETFNVHGCFRIEENITPPPDPLLPPIVNPAESTGIAFIEAETTTIMNIILYKGRTLLDIFDGNYSRVIPTSTTGDIEVDAPNIIITGDCTITIS